METKITAALLILLIITAITLSLGCIDDSQASSELRKDDNIENQGFTAVFAVAGLLAVTYLVLRKKDDKEEKEKNDDDKRGHR